MVTLTAETAPLSLAKVKISVSIGEYSGDPDKEGSEDHCIEGGLEIQRTAPGEHGGTNREMGGVGSVNQAASIIMTRDIIYNH